ncbi:protein-tyrosine-phosphatase [Alkanindiges hydrocarboniclasticus]|uniref:Protein-tyrosine-phosphatase n=1 Tax=Alkanindiges hydrocarboniclasticus TaxID=1907941 RepID=A0A1S8CTR4_9GAMM|nr:arsenate reductase ArsC [Alkanindiges hydrocarboniclasticus]ONG39819.1 protein-tyrosine-phosphatase [Alkanindiges hydrocarboniclasticus]
MGQKVWNVLVLCTGNSARSIMGEALINVLGQGRFKAYSAGSQPMGRVNPFAVEQAQTIGYDTSTVRSKSWDEFSQPDAIPMDIVITVCDSAAGESCPLWRGRPIKVHWGFADPSHIDGSDDDKRAAFAITFAQIRKKVEALMQLPIDSLTTEQLKAGLQAIGDAEV